MAAQNLLFFFVGSHINGNARGHHIRKLIYRINIYEIKCCSWVHDTAWFCAFMSFCDNFACLVLWICAGFYDLAISVLLEWVTWYILTLIVPTFHFENWLYSFVVLHFPLSVINILKGTITWYFCCPVSQKTFFFKFGTLMNIDFVRALCHTHSSLAQSLRKWFWFILII